MATAGEMMEEIGMKNKADINVIVTGSFNDLRSRYGLMKLWYW